MAMVWNSSDCFCRSALLEPEPSFQMSRTQGAPSSRMLWLALSA